MKKILVPAILLAAVVSIDACKTSKQVFVHPNTATTQAANKTSGLILRAGQKITAVSSSTSDTDMGMGMQMKNSNGSTNVLMVIASDEKSYSITNTLAKLNLSVEVMGQQTSYDSEKPEDKHSEVGKEASKKINVIDTSIIDKLTGDVINNKKNESPERPDKADDANPLTGILGGLGNDQGDPILSGAFFVIPQGKKINDTWSDSTSDNNVKTTKTYTIISIDKNVAGILVNGVVTGTIQTDMQGTSVAFNMSAKNKAEMVVDITTGLVSKVTNESDVTGNMDLMGQSMPVTSKVTTTIIYQY